MMKSKPPGLTDTDIECQPEQLHLTEKGLATVQELLCDPPHPNKLLREAYARLKTYQDQYGSSLKVGSKPRNPGET